MLPEQLTLQMTEAIEAFVPSTENPSHDDMVHLQESLTLLLLQVVYDKSHSKHNLWVIFFPKAVFAAKYGKPFTTPDHIGAFPPISQDAKA